MRKKDITQHTTTIIDHWHEGQTIKSLAIEYGCQPRRINSIILQQVSADDFQRINHRNRYHRGRLRVEQDIDKIIERLRTSDVTCQQLRKEYHVGHDIFTDVVLSNMLIDEYLALMKVREAEGGKKNRFKKGHPSWNKNLKGIHMSPATEFKPGCLRGNAARKYRKIGWTTVRIHEGVPTRYIKVAEGKWVRYAVYVWEKANGPVSFGYFVVCKDGNSMHDYLDNLKLVDRKGHLTLQMQRDPSMRTRCRASVSAAAKKRHIHNRKQRALGKLQTAGVTAAKRKLKAEKKQVESVRQKYICVACGYSQNTIPESCPKCGCCSFEKVA